MKKRYFVYILAFLLFSLVYPVHGETAAMNAAGIPNLSLSVNPTEKTEGFSAILYNNPNGLPTSEANAIAETGEGFIWIGSYAGLIRYDGNTFERFDSTTGIANVRCLYVDSRDRLWIGTNDSGVFVMVRGELTRWDKKDGLKSSSIRAITEGTDGTIYIGSTAGVAVIDREMKLTDLADERINQVTVKEFRRTEEGPVYGLTSDGIIFTLEKGQLTSFIEAGDFLVGGITAILPDPENPGFLYMGLDSEWIFYGTPEDDYQTAKIIHLSVSGTQLTGDVVDAFMRLVAKGEFRDPDDHGGGTTENIDNIHKAQAEGGGEKSAE